MYDILSYHSISYIDKQNSYNKEKHSIARKDIII